mmetsp:Transcript_12024/g.17888  ORF Transcript_12024/g.17888 Transcript_12024/m.17888 type:complete len:587 (+) Transcript_12024:110-1870(+)|eukprot:CAMPEP_0117421378 /NCGR_PEP_ID=MMETSP0758-20121206/2489_1 /TAXON_ID=63605 /ORGANISM="Percolomonas cosmopolitus, Strain AE-1 (ATCC 50343)" /LENGTH=586 /DNA_ID=CAMNT_0005203481 /DNA_START=55 /DNA_END=1815 /DNA_ORIENTATION=-
MSGATQQSIRILAQKKGIPRISEDITQRIAQEVETKLKSILIDAKKFRDHSKRRLLTTDDFNRALIQKNVQPLYGYKIQGDVPKDWKVTLGFGKVKGQNLYYIKDEEIDIKSALKVNFPSKIPIGPTVSSHWLAIEGEQPQIPQNPIRDAAQAREILARQELGLPPLPISQTKKSIMQLNESLAPLYENVYQLQGSKFIPTIEEEEKEEEKPKKRGRKTKKNDGKKQEHETKKNEKITIHNLPEKEREVFDGTIKVKHLVSNEHRLLFKKITQVVLDDHEANDMKRKVALRVLQSGKGLHQLVPYFVQFIIRETTINMDNLVRLENMVGMMRALLENQHIHLELYVHQMIPAILTCLLGSQLGDHKEIENHFQLRASAASLLACVVRDYAHKYANTKSRIAKELINSLLNPNCNHSTHYGAIMGLLALGPQVSNGLLFEPELNSNFEVLHALLRADAEMLLENLHASNDKKMHDAEEDYLYLYREIQMCLTALREAVYVYFDCIRDGSRLSTVLEQEYTIQRNHPATHRKKQHALLARILRQRALFSLPDDFESKYALFSSIFGEDILPAVRGIPNYQTALEMSFI